MDELSAYCRGFPFEGSLASAQIDRICAHGMHVLLLTDCALTAELMCRELVRRHRGSVLADCDAADADLAQAARAASRPTIDGLPRLCVVRGVDAAEAHAQSLLKSVAGCKSRSQVVATASRYSCISPSLRSCLLLVRVRSGLRAPSSVDVAGALRAAAAPGRGQTRRFAAPAEALVRSGVPVGQLVSETALWFVALCRSREGKARGVEIGARYEALQARSRKRVLQVAVLEAAMEELAAVDASVFGFAPKRRVRAPGSRRPPARRPHRSASESSESEPLESMLGQLSV